MRRREDRAGACPVPSVHAGGAAAFRPAPRGPDPVLHSSTPAASSHASSIRRLSRRSATVPVSVTFPPWTVTSTSPASMPLHGSRSAMSSRIRSSDRR